MHDIVCFFVLISLFWGHSILDCEIEPVNSFTDYTFKRIFFFSIKMHDIVCFFVLISLFWGHSILDCDKVHKSLF